MDFFIWGPCLDFASRFSWCFLRGSEESPTPFWRNGCKSILDQMLGDDTKNGDMKGNSYVVGYMKWCQPYIYIYIYIHSSIYNYSNYNNNDDKHNNDDDNDNNNNDNNNNNKKKNMCIYIYIYIYIYIIFTTLSE